jgi:hypothetical protein
MEAIRRNSRPLHGTETQKEIETDQQPPWMPKINIGNFGNKGSHVNIICGRISDEGYHGKSNHRNSSILVNLVKEFTVATSVKTLLVNIRIIIFNLRTAAFKAYCAICVRRSNFRHQASPRVSPREGTQRRKVEVWARNVR